MEDGLDDAPIIQAEVEAKCQLHEVELAEVFVLVLVERAEPAAVAGGEVAVMFIYPARDRLAFVLRGDQVRGAARGEGYPVHAGTIEWIHEGGGISN